MIEEVKKLVFKLLNNDNTGHGNDHILRVYKLAIKFAKEECANQEIVALAALLHDVDDYKLFGEENSKNLTNAKEIMSKVNIDLDIQKKVLEIIKTMGYKKSLSGIRPKSLEGKIVSDADMCDVLGANGIIRLHSYTSLHNKPFFDRNTFPIESIDPNNYRICADSAVNHIFEKGLKLRKLMLTNSGKKEAVKREKITIEFLRNLFIEEDATEWISYLDNYLE